jgi:VanZ family protein
VRKTLVFIKYWLPLLLWFALIFAASRDGDSFNRSSRIIAPLVKWLMPGLDPDGVDRVVLVVRKCAHAFEYAVLAWLFWRAFRHSMGVAPGKWSARVAFLAWLFATLYAVTDEWHQGFVPTRQGSIWDVILDSFGAAMGVGLIWLIGRWRRVW